MKVKIYTHPSSERKLKVAVMGRFRKLDAKPPKPLHNPSDDAFDIARDNQLSHQVSENPFTDDEGNPYHDYPEREY